MTSQQRRNLLLRDWARILERSGVPRDETDATAGELWQALLGHGARVTWLPDDPTPDHPRHAAPGGQTAAVAAVRAAVRPTTAPPATAEPGPVLGIPPWKAQSDADQA